MTLVPSHRACWTAAKKQPWWRWSVDRCPRATRSGRSRSSPPRPRGVGSSPRWDGRPSGWCSPTTTSSRGGKKMWCVPEIDREFIERMEDLLKLYAKPEEPLEPVVCLDERPVQLLDAERPGRAMRPGRLTKRDYEYVRKGTANIFCVVDPAPAGGRPTPRRTGRAGPSPVR